MSKEYIQIAFDFQNQDQFEILVAQLANLGFDPVYGARPLKRAIQQWLENPLAQEVLKGAYPPGSTIVVSLVGQDIAFSKKVKAAEAVQA